MKYDPFRRQFMDAYCIVDGSVFDPTRCDPIIWEIFDNINPALRFEGYNSSLGLMSSILTSLMLEEPPVMTSSVLIRASNPRPNAWYFFFIAISL